MNSKKYNYLEKTENALKSSDAEHVYIHVPFCIKKCNYCSFVSFTNIAEYEDIYTDALCSEISQSGSHNLIRTVYIGGGTPNILKISSLEKIVSALKKSFKISEDAEFTMEFNPKLSDINYIKEAKNIGINRVSLGAQSFNDDILKILGRLHNSRDTINAYEDVRKADIHNVSMDLMYGIFGQTFNMLENDTEFLSKLEPEHISTYGLKIEKNTPFEKFDKSNLPDEDLCADMYMKISEILSNAGYVHYEISNFAKPDRYSRHNTAYWKAKEYFGFGVSAHGYLNKIRYQNSFNINEYIKNPLQKEILEINDKNALKEEYIMLGLRLKEGINLNKLKTDFDYDLYNKKRDFINSITMTGHAVLDNELLFLTEKGFLISNYIIAELLA